jgi:hypothetical protein
VFKNNGSLRFVLLLLSFFIALFCSCNPGNDGSTPATPPPVPASNNWGPDLPNEQQMLDDTFRIDIKTISVTFDYQPEESIADCYAVVEFMMRSGQSRPLIHLDPVIRNKNVYGILLNNESLDIGNEADVRIESFENTSQQALVFQRDLGADVLHTLAISYRLNIPTSYGFITDVNDITGFGNEELFPTINTPHELARHILTFRVHSNNEYHCIGSGLVRQTVGDSIQEWILDTEREVSSYTVMFTILQVADTIYEERNVNGTDVRIIAYNNDASIEEAFNILEPLLPELAENIGPFPMPHGLSIFLTGTGGGMEYYGATITSLSALAHEVFHMYYACSTINKTYRDSWLDEAITSWYERSVNGNYAPIHSTFSSNMVSYRSPVSVGFDTRAYDQGSRIIEAVAQELGGRDRMIAFLKYVHSNNKFLPYTTPDFLNFLENYSGVNMRSQFLQWLYSSQSTEESASASKASPGPHWEKADTTPPDTILRKYTKH